MNVLVDSSIWIAYFRGSDTADRMDWLISEGLIVTNDLILSELLPALLVRGERRLVHLLREVVRSPLTPDWNEVIEMQTVCLQNGINKVGIPDLLIAQHARQYHLYLYTLDRHFTLISQYISLEILCGNRR